MTPSQAKDNQPAAGRTLLTPAAVSESQAEALSDAATQEAYRKAYIKQLRRMNCPGCGETEIY